jgi:lysophospholipase L1-like esterase
VPLCEHPVPSRARPARLRTRLAVGVVGTLMLFLVPAGSLAADGPPSLPATQPTTQPATQPISRPDILPGVHRVLVLGDSITYAGGYVDELDLYLLTHFPARRIELLDLGIPSETVTGLTEPEHPFPRPDVHERLDRTLRMLREANWTPELVLACYGMNDGIYRPLDGERFAKFREGMERLVKRVEKDGTRSPC